MSEIGDNGGPPIDPFAAIAAHIDDLNAEAKLHLDGKPVETQAQCDALDKLRKAATDAEMLAEDARKAEKKPHDDAAKAVQVKWKPFVDSAVRIKEAARSAAAPWKRKLIDDANTEAERVANEARITREAAEAEAKAARDANNLEAIEAADAQLANADTLDEIAKKAAKPMATGLRTYWIGTVENYSEYLEWLRVHRLPDLIDWMDAQVKKDVFAGERKIPGVLIKDEKR